jgi:hypothetical protein
VLGIFWKPSIRLAVGNKWDLTDLIGGVGEWAAVQLAMSTWLRKKR